MLDIMDNAKNAIEAYNAKLRTTSANIANMSVDGYKRLDVSFQEVFNRVLKSGSAPSVFSDIGGTNPLQSGGGATLANMKVDFTQGEFSESGNLSLGIYGKGLFIVSSDGGVTYQYTRAGAFQLDASGNLVTPTGKQVYGVNNSGTLTAITGLTGYNSTKLSWTADGELAEFNDTTNWDDNNVTQTGYRIALTYFNNPGGLEYVDGTSFTQTAASGEPATAVASNGNGGTIRARRVESSNVFYIGESIDALEIQRAMNASLTVVQMISQAISTFVNKIS